MTSRVTLNVFSGKPNPSWLLSEKQDAELHERLAAAHELTTSRPSGSFGGLGYRGLSITRETGHPAGPLSMLLHEGILDVHADGAANRAAGPDLEAWLMKSAPRSVPKVVTDHVNARVAASELSLPHLPSTTSCPACHAADAPVYNPGKWNIPSVQPHNNCYNYANDQITNTFAQPGRATGHMYTALSCASVQPAAQSDGLVPTPNFTNLLASGHGWYVALVIWPNVDFHWYRQDKVGCWSHKPGSTAARDVDNSGHQITDPRTCNRGPYTSFCSFMVTKRTVHIR